MLRLPCYGLRVEKLKTMLLGLVLDRFKPTSAKPVELLSHTNMTVALSPNLVLFGCCNVVLNSVKNGRGVNLVLEIKLA